MNELKPCPFCGSEARVELRDIQTGVECTNKRCITNTFVQPTYDQWNSRPIEDALQKRIAYLEEQLRWRPVWEQPEKSGYYEVEFDNGNFHDMIFYNEHSSWRCSQEHVNITGWRPIPELELKGE